MEPDVKSFSKSGVNHSPIPKVDYESALLPQDHIKEYCQKYTLPELNKCLMKDSTPLRYKPYGRPDAEISKRQESNPQVAPNSFHHFGSHPDPLSNPLLSPNLNQTNESEISRQIGDFMQHNQLYGQLNTLAGISPFPDLMLHLKSKILLDLFHNAFKRYLQTVKGDIAKNLNSALEMGPIKAPISMSQPRLPKYKRKNTDMMSSDISELSHRTKANMDPKPQSYTVEDTDGRQSRLQSDLVS
jgi:hypothetical protein